jgi:hypothetical protein
VNGCPAWLVTFLIVMLRVFYYRLFNHRAPFHHPPSGLFSPKRSTHSTIFETLTKPRGVSLRGKALRVMSEELLQCLLIVR